MPAVKDGPLYSITLELFYSDVRVNQVAALRDGVELHLVSLFQQHFSYAVQRLFKSCPKLLHNKSTLIPAQVKSGHFIHIAPNHTRSYLLFKDEYVPEFSHCQNIFHPGYVYIKNWPGNSTSKTTSTCGLEGLRVKPQTCSTS